MIKLKYKHGLLFCSLPVSINDKTLDLTKILIDTGSATTLINADYISLDGSEKIINAQGIGGYERILKKNINTILIDDKKLSNIALSIGDMDYGIDIDIDLLIGLDLLKSLNANIDLASMMMIFNQ